MNEEFLWSCINYFGIEKQQIAAIEEMSELTQQLSKFLIGHKNRSRDKVVEEYVDVLIMMKQLSLIYNITDSEVEKQKEFKFSRLKGYIKSLEEG